MDTGRLVTLQPPFYILTQGGTPGAHDWIEMNHSTTFWFTTKDAARNFLIRTPKLPERANWDILHDWRDVDKAMHQLALNKLPYMFLDPEHDEVRRLWARDIYNQLCAVKPTGIQPVEVRDKLLFELDLYCDESGKAPVNDSDDILIVSVVVVKGGRVSELPSKKYKKRHRTVKYLTKNRLRFMSFMVKPFPGYAAALDLKMKTYQRVAEKNRELGIPNLVFSASDQINPRHFVWMFAMQSIVNWLVPDVARQGNMFIEKIRVFLNQISQTEEMETFFRRFLTFDGPQSSLDVLKAAADNPLLTEQQRRISTRWADKFRLKHHSQITAQFDKDKPFDGDRGWLRLADRVAHWTFCEYRNEHPKPGFYDALRKAGENPDPPLDITESVLKHDPQMVEDWERKTGQRP